MHRTSGLAWILLPLALASPSGTAMARPTAPATIVTFDDAELGRAPSEFESALTGGGGPVAWVVSSDPTAPSGERVLMQTSADTTSSRFPLCIYEPISASDVTLSVKFKALDGRVDQAAGLVWRHRDAANYYVVRANALEDNVVLYKVVGGKRSDLKPVGSGLFAYGKDAEVERGRWHTLKLEAIGDRFAVFLDGVHLFDVEDATFREAGKVGLWTKADSVTAFDDLSISPAVREDAALP